MIARNKRRLARQNAAAGANRLLIGPMFIFLTVRFRTLAPSDRISPAAPAWLGCYLCRNCRGCGDRDHCGCLAFFLGRHSRRAIRRSAPPVTTAPASPPPAAAPAPVDVIAARPPAAAPPIVPGAPLTVAEAREAVINSYLSGACQAAFNTLAHSGTGIVSASIPDNPFEIDNPDGSKKWLYTPAAANVPDYELARIMHEGWRE